MDGDEGADKNFQRRLPVYKEKLSADFTGSQ